MSYEKSTLENQTQEDIKPNFNGGSFKFPEEEQEKIQERLKTYLSREDISKRTAYGGSSVSYIEGWKSFQIANEIFGFNGWSTSIVNSSVDFLDVNDGKFSVGVNCVVRVTLKDGSFHEDIGYGIMENSKSKGAAFEKARKEAVTDGVKRALRYFGNSLGNCLYDKDYLKEVSKAPAKASPSFGLNSCPMKPSGFGGSSFNALNPSSTDVSTNMNLMQQAAYSVPHNQLGSSTSTLSLNVDLNPLASSSSHSTYTIKKEVPTPTLPSFGSMARPGSSSAGQAQISSSNDPTNGLSEMNPISTGQPSLQDSFEFDFDDASFSQIDEGDLAILNNNLVHNEQTTILKQMQNDAPSNANASNIASISPNQMPSENGGCTNNNIGGISMSTSFVSAATLRKFASPLATRSMRPSNQNSGSQVLGDRPDLKRHRGS